MKNKMLAALAVLVALPLFAQQQSSSPQGSTQDTAALEQHIKDLEERLIALEGQVRMLKSGQAGAAAAPAAATPATAPTVIVLRPMRPREELFVLRSACGADVRSLCGGVPPGGGRILQCLATQAASLSPDCRGVLGQFAAQ